MSDDLQVAFLPGIVERIEQSRAASVPRAQLIVQQADYRKAAAMLERREVSLVVGYLDELPAAAKLRTILRVGYVMVTNDAAADVASLADYCARQHLPVTFAGDLVGYVDEALGELGASREIALSVSTFAVVPWLLKAADWMVTVPDYLATALAAEPGLRALPLPFESPRFDISIAWSATSDADPGERILRDVIFGILREGEGPRRHLKWRR